MKKLKRLSIDDVCFNRLFDFYNIKRASFKTGTDKKVYGTLLYLDTLLTKEDKEEIKNTYNNVMFFKMQKEYAKEIQYSILVIMDKKITDNLQLLKIW